LHAWFIIFFAATAAASLAGGTVHGFVKDDRVLWRLVLVLIGVVSASAWTIGAYLLFSESIARSIAAAACVELAIYAAIIVFVADSFAIAIANYLPSTLFLIVAFFTTYRANPAVPLLAGLSGLVLTLVAAGTQQARVMLHPTYFNHNALYHLLQAMALFLIFRAAMFLTTLSLGFAR
jgi:hypothetical protein